MRRTAGGRARADTEQQPSCRLPLPGPFGMGTPEGTPAVTMRREALGRTDPLRQVELQGEPCRLNMLGLPYEPQGRGGARGKGPDKGNGVPLCPDSGCVLKPFRQRPCCFSSIWESVCKLIDPSVAMCICVYID